MRSLGYEANNALDDQRLALRWIKKHIAGFGGDSERVTFMGQSAGGGKVRPQSGLVSPGPQANLGSRWEHPSSVE